LKGGRRNNRTMGGKKHGPNSSNKGGGLTSFQNGRQARMQLKKKIPRNLARGRPDRGWTIGQYTKKKKKKNTGRGFAKEINRREKQKKKVTGGVTIEKPPVEVKGEGRKMKKRSRTLKSNGDTQRRESINNDKKKKNLQREDSQAAVEDLIDSKI